MAACSFNNSIYDNSDDNQDNTFVLSTFLEVVEAIPLAKRWHFTPNASDMLQTAANVTRCMTDPENNHQLSAFCGALGGKLNLCFKCRHGKFDKDAMWGLYH
ncbi:PREDICTED: uncharacterized protein LOC109586798 [Amphimedon queenslandica]|uniref:Uncharacterized protein n=1 Tax=Amphimedon queenslandica TaxID=400682 RepID=A0AAN0JNF7_AMPQE|nr:PREDICTED: uncharacterized protein LOC109586798 [Amphimedon queenslandica]|eukprot:XP_019858572.1 PREDICTED: uncharacterized protein LOC109586798 [Amphimedon queenslandica]